MFNLCVIASQRRQAKAQAGDNRARAGVITGSQYRSKKAKGDMVKPGMLEPFAYHPLDPMMLNRRNRTKTAREFESVVGRSAAAGAAGASKFKAKRSSQNGGGQGAGKTAGASRMNE